MISCALCSKSFSRRDNMKRHIRLLHRTCEVCLTKIGDDNNHICYIQPKNIEIETESKDEGIEQESGDEVESEPESEDDSQRSESEEDNMDNNSSDSDAEVDIYSKDDELLESDASITSSEDENEPMESADESEDEGETVCLEWPNHSLFLTSYWQKYGGRQFKFIRHRSWLEDFIGLSYPKILKRVRHATENQLKALFEIASNLLLGNVFMLRTQRPYLKKNRGLVRALANSNISLERKRKLIIERGGEFVERLIEVVRPLFETLKKM